MAKTTLTISSKNYSSWSLRGWLMCKLGGLEFDEVLVSEDDILDGLARSLVQS